MGNKLSNSAVDKYIECSLCYKLHYIDGVRPVRTKSALLFGHTLDIALNHLLLNHKNMSKDILLQAKITFLEEWKKVDPKITDFSKSDLDQELIDYSGMDHPEVVKEFRSLQLKGMLFLDQYYTDVIPKIKEVIAVQEPVSLKNDDGDEITGILDLIVKWEDDKVYLMDNKSSSVKYEADSAKTGQQLPLYYYIVKEKYKLDGVGYIVLSKKINKNKVKKCRKCGMINTGTHTTCANIVDLQFNTRCKGEFDITMNPSVDIQYIINQVDEKDEQRVMDKFDEVNYNVTNGYFATEHTQIRNKFYQFCPYKEYTPDNPNFIIKKTPKKRGRKKK